MENNNLPATVEECLEYLKTIRYKSQGFGVLSLDYVYDFNYWIVCVRNPVNFNNPDTKSATPLEACHKMIVFLNELKQLKNEKST